MAENGYGYSGDSNNFGYYQYQLSLRKKREKKEIRKLGLLTGGALLSFVLIQNVIWVILTLTGFYDIYSANPMISTVTDIILSLVEILLPFVFFGRKMKKIAQIPDIAPLAAPTDKTLSLLSIPAGLAVCMGANIVTSYINIILGVFGINLTLPDMANPQGLGGFVLSVLRVAVVAAIVEEISFRGCVMQPLRRYGDGFAIAASAIAFGIMHCNLIQAPFALIVGIGLGYIAIKTNSLWCVIIIHALNNLISTVVTYLMEAGMNEQAVNTLYVLVIYTCLAVGSVCLFFFVRRANRVCPPPHATSALSGLEKAVAYFFNPTMLIALGLMFYYTAQFVAFRW